MADSCSFRAGRPLLARHKELACCCSEPQGQLNKDGAESISADVFRGNSRRSSIPARPSLISTAGKPGFAHELATRVVVLKARGRVFDTQDGLGELRVRPGHHQLGSSRFTRRLVSRGTLQETVRIHSFLCPLPSITGTGDPHVVSNRNSLPNECPTALTTRVAREHPSGQHGCERSNVRPHLFVRHAHLQYIPGIGRSHRLPIGTLSWPLGSPNLLTSQSTVSCLAAS